jgi:Na+/H+ antiporter NhaD/arsenite permease-like protein
MYLMSQITVIVCFIILILILFQDQIDYISYAVLLVAIAAGISAIEIDAARHTVNYILAINWEVVIFLIALFIIVEILNEALVFHEIARLIVSRYKNNIHKMFWVICLVSTLSAVIIQDLSVIIIFVPVIIIACQDMKMNPSPFLFGITICVNLASTLSPFGSAGNIIIANYFSLNFFYFLTNLGPFFIISMIGTLVLMDRFYLKKRILLQQSQTIKDEEGKTEDLSLKKVSPQKFKRNIGGLVIFIGLLIFIPYSHIAAVLGMLLFVFLNRVLGEDEKERPTLTHFLNKIKFKLIFFFICLFILVFLMEINGLIQMIQDLMAKITTENVFLLALVILLVTSIASGLIDNIPVTMVFLPIINFLISNGGVPALPLIIAFVIGINVGGNFLPQGSTADMMTLELAQKNGVTEVNYKSLTKMGGIFALFHFLLGVVYLGFVVLLL